MNKPALTLCLGGLIFISGSALAQDTASKATLTSDAMRGDIQAQYNLCRLYQKENNAGFAVSWCEKAAFAGNIAAQRQLGWLSVQNAENADDLKKAYMWFGVALAQEYNISAHNEWVRLGAHFKEHPKTLRRLKKETDHLFKKYVKADEEQSTDSLIAQNKSNYLAGIRQKAGQKDASSQAVLGTFYEFSGDYASALDWYRKAAKNGYIDAQSYIGRAQPDSGIGGLYNDTERYAWMSVALAQKYNYIDKLSLSLIGQRLTAEKKSEAQQLAQSYYENYVNQDTSKNVPALIRAAENSYMQRLISKAKEGYVPAEDGPSGEFNSALAVLKDIKPSMEWHMRAAKDGNVLAQYTIGHMHEQGIEVPQNTLTAAQWYKRAAMQGYGPAQFALGQLYFENREQDSSNIIEAFAWLDVATKQDYPGANITRDAIAKSFDKEETRLAGILSRKYHRLYVEPFQEADH